MRLLLLDLGQRINFFSWQFAFPLSGVGGMWVPLPNLHTALEFQVLYTPLPKAQDPLPRALSYPEEVP